MSDAAPATVPVPEATPSLMEKTRYGVWRCIGAMFTEPKGEDGDHAVSMKRVMAVGAFSICMMAWYAGHDAPPQTFYFLCAVVLAQGSIAIAQAWKGAPAASAAPADSAQPQ